MDHAANSTLLGDDYSFLIDLSNFSFDEFITFLFAREAPDQTFDEDGRQKAEPWYWHVQDTCVATTICAYYIRLFLKPEFLLERFSKPQLEQGCWAIQASALDCGLHHLLRDTDLPLASREECIRSMASLFKRLFAQEPLDTSVYMWWDLLCYDWHCGNRNRERGGEDEWMQDVLFETLAQILALDSVTCQGAALHGLSHLHHPDTEELIWHLHPKAPFAHSAAKGLCRRRG